MKTPSEVIDANRRKYVIVQLNDRKAKLQLDTASEVTLTPRKNIGRLGQTSTDPTKLVTHNASSGILNFEGEMKCHVCYVGQRIRAKWFVTNQPELNQIGLGWLNGLNLLKRMKK